MTKFIGINTRLFKKNALSVGELLSRYEGLRRYARSSVKTKGVLSLGQKLILNARNVYMNLDQSQHCRRSIAQNLVRILIGKKPKRACPPRLLETPKDLLNTTLIKAKSYALTNASRVQKNVSQRLRTTITTSPLELGSYVEAAMLFGINLSQRADQFQLISRGKNG